MAPHSSTLAWRVLWMEELGRLQSMASQSRMRLSDFTFTFHFHALEKKMAIHSSILAWRIPGTGEPGRLLSMGSHSQTRLKPLSSSSEERMGINYCCCSVAQLCLSLCDSMDCSTPGFPVLHYLPEFVQIHVH